MNNFNSRFYEMLNRIVVFANTYAQLFAAGTVPAELLAQIQAALQALSTNATSQASGMGAIRRSSGGRSDARGVLRSQMEAISRTARGLNLPEFWMPRNRGDRSLLQVGQVFLKNAQPLKQSFIDNHLPGDFLEKLSAAVQNLETAINDQTVSKGALTAATAAIEQTRSQAVTALQQLDPIMENLLQDDPPTLAVWQSCRHVERPSVSKPVANGDPPPVAAPSNTKTTAAAG